MNQLLPRTNRAIEVNGNHVVNGKLADIAITYKGSNWYWTVCAIMFVSTIVFAGLSYTKTRSHRLFHYITAAITMIAAVAYFSMGADLGQVPIEVEYKRTKAIVSGMNREIFYVRYVDWALTTPLLLLDLLLTAGLPWPTLLYTILINEIMIVTGLIGALVSSTYKWGYFTFGCVAFLWVAWTVVFTARKHAIALGPDIGRTYTLCGSWTIFLWFIYPIAWGLSEGGNVISPNSEAVMYGILDVLAKPVFGALLLWGHRNIDPSRLGVHIEAYEDRALHKHEKNTSVGQTGTTGLTDTTGTHHTHNTTTAPTTTV